MLATILDWCFATFLIIFLIDTQKYVN